MKQGMIEGIAPYGEENLNPSKFDFTDSCAWRMAKHLGMSQGEIASRIGCAQKTVSDRLTGRTGNKEQYEESMDSLMVRELGESCGKYGGLYIFINVVLPKLEYLMRMPEDKAVEMRKAFAQGLGLSEDLIA